MSEISFLGIVVSVIGVSALIVMGIIQTSLNGIVNELSKLNELEHDKFIHQKDKENNDDD